MFNLNGTTTLYALDGLGHFHRLVTQITPLGPRSDLLMAAAQDEGVAVPNFARIGELPVHMYAAREPAYAVRLPFLRMRTFFRALGTGENVHLVPWFVSDQSIDLTCEWKPPYNCDLFFVYRSGKCFLIAGYTNPSGQRTLRKMPLPNIHNDGAICMGGWRPPLGETVLDQLNSAVTNFTTSEWNADLLGEQRSYLSQFMRFSVEGREQLPALSPWYNYAAIVAGASYNWVASLMQGLPVEPVAPVVTVQAQAPTPTVTVGAADVFVEDET